MQEIIINVDDQKDKTINLLENGKLIETYKELQGNNRLEGNIYIGKVKDVLPGMQAAFIDIGEGKNTFIHVRDVIPKVSNETGNKNEVLSKHDIKNYIKTNMPLLIQVKRDSNNQKGARVSTHISLYGRFVVVMLDSKFITISQKIENIKEKDRLKNIVKEITPKGYGIIIRTSANGRSKEEIETDINSIVKKFEIIKKEYKRIKEDNSEVVPKLLYENEGMVHKILIDIVDQDVKKIWTNSKEEYNEIAQILKDTQNEKIVKLELKQDKLMELYELEKQLEKIKNRKIWLKCGGFITIDKTEALTAIDVNSGKFIGKKDLEQTILTVNKEASIEIAKQIRLRDIGGIIIIDYIDMEKDESKNQIIEVLKQNLKKDRSKTQVIGFTPLNLLEMTRKHMCSNE